MTQENMTLYKMPCGRLTLHLATAEELKLEVADTKIGVCDFDECETCEHVEHSKISDFYYCLGKRYNGL